MRNEIEDPTPGKPTTKLNRDLAFFTFDDASVEDEGGKIATARTNQRTAQLRSNVQSTRKPENHCSKFRNYIVDASLLYSIIIEALDEGLREEHWQLNNGTWDQKETYGSLPH